MMDRIESLNNFFECKDIVDNQKMKIAKSKKQGVALTWWNFVQGERLKEGRGMITSWKKMIAEIKRVYVPRDYEVQLHKRRKNLRQKEMDVCAYTEEFQKLSIKSKKVEDESERVARYLNGLRWKIQEELNLLCLDTVHKCYQLALKVEEKLKRRQDQSS